MFGGKFSKLECLCQTLSSSGAMNSVIYQRGRCVNLFCSSTGDGKAVSISHMDIPGGKQACEEAAKEWSKSVSKFPMSDSSAICIKAK
jgi:hypothetical protein